MADEAIVYLVDDDEAIRRSLAFLLGTGGFAVRIYESATDMLEKIGTPKSGCIISDVRMPGMDGIQLLGHLREKGIDLPVIIMTGHADVALAVQAMKAGALDFIEKPFDDETLMLSVRDAMSHRAMEASKNGVAEVRARRAALSERETQILEGLLAGHPNKTMAYDLGISPRTIEVHRASVMKKMAARSLSDLVRMCLQSDNS